MLTEALSAKTILIVDDRAKNLQILTKYLNNANYKTLIAIDGKRAISIAKKAQPDLILLDVVMTIMDGFEVCRHLKSDRLTKDIPIIFMTALTETQNKIRGLKLGAADYVTKPFEEEELLARIKTHLTLHHLYQASLQDAQRRRLMLEISDRIRNSLDLRVILATATAEIRDLFDCSFVGIATLEEQVEIAAYASEGKMAIEPQTFISDDYLCPNRAAYQSYLQSRIELRASRSRLIVPIAIDNTDYKSDLFFEAEAKTVVDNRLYGWLIADRNSAQVPWQTDEINLLQELTTHLAMGITQGLLHQKLTELALLDSLTRIYNRRAFDRYLRQEWNKLKRIHAPLSLIICDIDYFKIYNDTFGHQQGDRCLQQVAEAMQTALKRPGDILARYGGEEFAIILPQTDRTGAATVGEEIRKAIAKLAIPHLNSLADSVVTVSVGVATTIPDAENYEGAIEAADLALYRAKKQGRNRVAVYSESITEAAKLRKIKNT